MGFNLWRTTKTLCGKQYLTYTLSTKESYKFVKLNRHNTPAFVGSSLKLACPREVNQTHRYCKLFIEEVLM